MRIEEGMKIYGRIFDQNCTYHVTPCEGVPEMLYKLKKQGVKLAVLSNKPHCQAVKAVHAIYGEKLFDWVRGESDEMLQEQKSVSVENAVMREEETQKTELVFTEEPFVQKETPVFESLPLREMSDELERLSQRYGRGMEEWLDDQSPI